MKREDLKSKGLSDEQIEFVMQQNGQDIENAKQNAAATEKARADGLQQQLATLTSDLADARNNAANAKDLKDKLDAANAKLQASTKANAIRDALAEYKPRDAAMLARLLDDAKITLAEDGTVSGLKEQVEPLKQNSAYLFSDAPDSQGGNAGTDSGGGAFDMNAFLRG